MLYVMLCDMASSMRRFKKKTISLASPKSAKRKKVLDAVAEELSPEYSVTRRREGHFFCDCGTTLAGRYVVRGLLGEGVYATVFYVWDSKRMRPVALKVQRCKASYASAAQREIAVLRRLGRDDATGTLCVALLDAFTVQAQNGGEEHVCLVFELLDRTLLEEIRSSGECMSVARLRTVARSLLTAVAHVHALGIVHSDLKPENIMLRGAGAGSSVTLIDFGTSFLADAPQKTSGTRKIQTLEYRSPEAIVRGGKPFTTAIDVWSVGCILFECATGEYLFDPIHHESSEADAHLEQIALIRDGALGDVLEREFDFPRHDAQDLAAFLLRFLAIDPNDAMSH